MRREFRCCHFRMRALLEKTVQSKGCTLFQHERVKMVLGALLDLFWIPFGDHLGDVLALVRLFGALFGRQSAVILFILASDKAPKRTSDTLLERLEPGKLALEPLHISLGPLQSYLDPSRSYFRASKHQFLIIQCSNRTYVACQKHLLIIIDQVIRPPILGLFDLGEPLSFLAA